MGAMASQITRLTMVYSTVYSDADQRKHQSSASLALSGEFTGGRWNPRTNRMASNAENVSIWWRHHELPLRYWSNRASESVIKFNILRPSQNGRHFPDDIFVCIFLNKNAWISISILLKFVLKGPINNSPALVQTVARRRPGDKPLSEPMMFSLLTHICVTRPQCFNSLSWNSKSI